MHINKLPPEILCEIFWWVVSTGPKSYGRTAVPARGTPLRVSQVCKTWRDIALSYGRLWSFLYINGRSLHDAYVRDGFDLVVLFDMWIARSGRAALNCVIDWDFGNTIIGGEGIRCVKHIVTTLIKE